MNSINQDEPLYNVFVRNWWRDAGRDSMGKRMREPGAGPKRYKVKGVNWTEARRICELYNTTHKPGFLSRKAEFEQCRN